MYLYPLDDDELPIPRFLSISKAHKCRNLIECNINDHLPANQSHGNEVSKSESIIVKKKCLEKLLVKETLEIEEGSGNHKILNCEKSHVDDQINSIILTTKLEILEKHDVDKVQENMFTENYHLSKENSSILPKMELETKSIEKTENTHDESKTKLGKLCQKEIIDDESGKRGSLACETSTKMDRKSYSSNSKNATHLDLQQNILPLEKSLPHSLIFKKVQKNEWTFDDESNKVFAKIQNIANENEMNHDQYIFNDHGTIVSQKIDEQLQIHAKEELKRHTITLESICGDPKNINNESSICTSDTLAKENESKVDNSDCLESTLMSRMNHNLYHVHKQIGTFDVTCNEQSENNIGPWINSKAFQPKDKELLTTQHMVRLYYLIYSFFN